MSAIRTRANLLNLRRGIKNLVRWFPVIWNDDDSDWEYLAILMERKLTWMAECFEHGNHVEDIQHSKKMRQCVFLLNRMTSDHNMNDDGLLNGCSSSEWARRVCRNDANDSRYLGMLLGKYMKGW